MALVGWDKACEVQTLPFSKMQPMNTLGTSEIVLGIVWNPLDLAMTIPAAFREASSA